MSDPTPRAVLDCFHPDSTVRISRFCPSHRNLSHGLCLIDNEPNSELPGEDQPETMDKPFGMIHGRAGSAVPV